jgi:hypothetical protein
LIVGLLWDIIGLKGDIILFDDNSDNTNQYMPKWKLLENDASKREY